MQNTAKQNYPVSATSYNTRPGNKVGLFYNASNHTWDETITNTTMMLMYNINTENY